MSRGTNPSLMQKKHSGDVSKTEEEKKVEVRERKEKAKSMKSIVHQLEPRKGKGDRGGSGRYSTTWRDLNKRRGEEEIREGEELYRRRSSASAYRHHKVRDKRNQEFEKENALPQDLACNYSFHEHCDAEKRER